MISVKKNHLCASSLMHHCEPWKGELTHSFADLVERAANRSGTRMVPGPGETEITNASINNSISMNKSRETDLCCMCRNKCSTT